MSALLHHSTPSSPVLDKTVIFTADDFGMSPALNAAVALAHGRGLLKGASLMVTGAAVDQAVALARVTPELCLGVHLTLIQGRSVLPPQDLPHLVDAQGSFCTNPVQAGWRYYWRAELLPEIRRELAAQIEAALAAGLKIWFLNSHVNLHLHPSIFPMVVDLAREYGIPAVVNVGPASKIIKTGQLLRVDGDRGVVTILDS